ncbi:MAG: hypothetical protein CME65_00315 [Halobacteriovoraceae bacterium]|nr:hypothetical protein [Halobacteriovoraceae bacterium]|tara:strand:- start:7226 stop:7558 length:333 start_codon:yes stop_codon:yes gene_type:complete
MSSNKEDDDLIGFRDFIEKDKRPSPPKEKRSINHEMQTFLQREEQRLRKLVDLYEEKSNLIKNYDQYHKLRQKASAHLHDKRKETIRSLKSGGTHFKKNLEELLGSYFKN